MVFDITTQGNTGFTGSETSACNGKLSSGMRTPAMAIDHAGVAGRNHADLACANLTARRLDRLDRTASAAADRRHRAVLDDVHAEPVGSTCESPRTAS
jgi:hypothetical protein